MGDPHVTAPSDDVAAHQSDTGRVPDGAASMTKAVSMSPRSSPISCAAELPEEACASLDISRCPMRFGWYQSEKVDENGPSTLPLEV